jgi:four helix bundle protein
MRDNSIRSFKDLIVLRRSRALCVAVYRVANALPATERYGLSQQLCRGAVSICANIAEGHARLHRGEFVHHLSFALGSLAECETLMLLAADLGMVSASQLEEPLALADEVGRMLMAMLKKLRTYGAPREAGVVP